MPTRGDEAKLELFHRLNFAGFHFSFPFTLLHSKLIYQSISIFPFHGDNSEIEVFVIETRESIFVKPVIKVKMQAGEVKVAEDGDFKRFIELCVETEGWKQEYNKRNTVVHTKTNDVSDFKMFKVP